MSEQQNQPPFMPPVSVFTGPVAELIAQRMLLPPSRPGLLAVLDHFEILRVLGGGGMGIVLLARDSDTGRDVAIKLVKSELVTNQHVDSPFSQGGGALETAAAYEHRAGAGDFRPDGRPLLCHALF